MSIKRANYWPIQGKSAADELTGEANGTSPNTCVLQFFLLSHWASRLHYTILSTSRNHDFFPF